MMKRVAASSLLVITGLLVTATPGHAWHGHGGWHRGHHPGHHHVHQGFVWYGPRYYYPRTYYVYSSPPAVVIEQPPVYVQQPPAAAPPPPPPPPPPPAATTPSAPSAHEGSWYYCASAKAYYPTAPSCPEPWIKVPPR
jgi:hypothetical protein